MSAAQSSDNSYYVNLRIPRALRATLIWKGWFPQWIVYALAPQPFHWIRKSFRRSVANISAC